MSKTAIIFWSGTGNTETMANAILEGASGAELFNVADISADQAAEYDTLILGCPAMGAETLEESEFEPFYQELKGSLSGKKVALFGSYDWGDGEWIRNWADDVKAAGADLVGKPLQVQVNDISDCADACKEFGANAVK